MAKKPKPIIRVYTDGAYSRTSGIGSVAFAATDYEHKILYQWCDAYKRTTSNRMELWAAIHALDWCNNNYPDLRPVLYTDSRYLNNMQYWIPRWRRGGWFTQTGDTVKNIDLVIMLSLIIEQSKHNVTSYWVRGHNENKGNNLAHNLAEHATKNAFNLVDDMGGTPLLTMDDLLEVCHSEDINRVAAHCLRLGD
jgi:ribonuclease HI